MKKAMREKGGMARDFAPFGGITRIRFKGSARFFARLSLPAPLRLVGVEHKMHRRRVKERSATGSPKKCAGMC